MENEHYKVIVVGSGPAGSAAAFTLARLGITVCIIDKSEFPRDKLCGGLFTGRSLKAFKKIFSAELNPEIFSSCNKVSFFSGGEFLEKQDGYSDIHFTMRIDLDHYLHTMAVREGAHPILGSPVNSVNIEEKSLVLGDGRNMSFDFLIGADGVNSSIAKILFGKSFNPKHVGFGLEVEVPKEEAPLLEDRIEIDFGAATWGYGWVFPKKNSYTIGVGGIHSLNGDLKNKMDNYLSLQGLDGSKMKYKGQYIPFGDFRKVPGKGSVLLCGDAAGLVDPISGEGIAYSMLSGFSAAKSISVAIEKNDPELAIERYLKEYKKISLSIRQANFWRYLIFPKILRKPFKLVFGDAGTLQRGYLDILAGEREYSSLPWLFIVQLAKAIAKPIKLIWRK